MMFIFFFFKQKTAYEMRISDWSSDVCSSDLSNCGEEHDDVLWAAGGLSPARQADHASDRKSVVSGKSVSVRVDLGGRRIIKKKNIHGNTYILKILITLIYHNSILHQLINYYFSYNTNQIRINTIKIL